MVVVVIVVVVMFVIAAVCGCALDAMTVARIVCQLWCVFLSLLM